MKFNIKVKQEDFDKLQSFYPKSDKKYDLIKEKFQNFLEMVPKELDQILEKKELDTSDLILVSKLNKVLLNKNLMAQGVLYQNIFTYEELEEYLEQGIFYQKLQLKSNLNQMILTEKEIKFLQLYLSNISNLYEENVAICEHVGMNDNEKNEFLKKWKLLRNVDNNLYKERQKAIAKVRIKGCTTNGYDWSLERDENGDPYTCKRCRHLRNDDYWSYLSYCNIKNDTNICDHFELNF